MPVKLYWIRFPSTEINSAKGQMDLQISMHITN